MLTKFIRQLLIDAIEEHLAKLYQARKELQAAIEELEAIKKKYIEPSQAVRVLYFEILANGNLKEIKMAIQKVTEAKKFTFKAVDQFGNEAQVEGAQWALSDPAKGSLAMTDDGKQCMFTPAGEVGEVDLQLAVDAKIGEGEMVLEGKLPLTLIAGDAVGIEIKEV